MNRILKRYFSGVDASRVVVQVGSHDGIQGDPIYPFIRSGGVRAILIEAVPELFERLRAVHSGNASVACVNAGVTPGASSLSFFVVDNSEGLFPAYFDQLGSFDRTVLERQRKTHPAILDHIREIEVECRSLTSIAEELGIEGCSLLHLDTEGLDLRILEDVDLSLFGRDMIIFEHVHLEESRYRAFLRDLRGRGYRLRDTGTDTVAIRGS